MTASAAPAREIRALPSLTGLPPGCLAHPVPDDTAEPHLRQGEFAVIDATDRAPAHGELFLIAYGGPTAREACALRIVEVRSRPVRILVDDEPAECVRWFAGPYRRPRTRAELHRWIEAGRAVVTVEGPFAPGQIERRLVGRVVGILAPALKEPRRARVGRRDPT